MECRHIAILRSSAHVTLTCTPTLRESFCPSPDAIVRISVVAGIFDAGTATDVDCLVSHARRPAGGGGGYEGIGVRLRPGT